MSEALHVTGDEGVEMTLGQKEKAETEKQSLLARVKKSPNASDNSSTEVQQAIDMVIDLNKAEMGQGDENELSKIKERLDTGRALNFTQSEHLNELYSRYL